MIVARRPGSGSHCSILPLNRAGLGEMIRNGWQTGLSQAERETKRWTRQGYVEESVTLGDPRWKRRRPLSASVIVIDVTMLIDVILIDKRVDEIFLMVGCGEEQNLRVAFDSTARDYHLGSLVHSNGL